MFNRCLSVRKDRNYFQIIVNNDYIFQGCTGIEIPINLTLALKSGKKRMFLILVKVINHNLQIEGRIFGQIAAQLMIPLAKIYDDNYKSRTVIDFKVNGIAGKLIILVVNNSVYTKIEGLIAESSLISDRL